MLAIERPSTEPIPRQTEAFVKREDSTITLPMHGNSPMENRRGFMRAHSSPLSIR